MARKGGQHDEEIPGPEREEPKIARTSCGAQHGDCPSSWKGTCDLSASHDGSRHCGSSLLAREVAGNLYVWGALLLCAAMLLLAVYVPPVARALRLVDPGARGWGVVMVMSLLPLAAGTILRRAGRPR